MDIEENTCLLSPWWRCHLFDDRMLAPVTNTRFEGDYHATTSPIDSKNYNGYCKVYEHMDTEENIWLLSPWWRCHLFGDRILGPVTDIRFEGHYHASTLPIDPMNFNWYCKVYIHMDIEENICLLSLWWRCHLFGDWMLAPVTDTRFEGDYHASTSPIDSKNYNGYFKVYEHMDI